MRAYIYLFVYVVVYACVCIGMGVNVYDYWQFIVHDFAAVIACGSSVSVSSLQLYDSRVFS